jgi:hypothetical protein
MPPKDHKTSWPQARIDELRRLKAAGHSLTTIGKMMGTSRTNIHNLWKKYGPLDEGGRGAQEANDPLGKPPEQEDMGKASVAYNGDASLSRDDRPATIEEVREMGGISDEFVAHEPVVGQWNGFYKLKNYMPRAMMRRLISIIQDGGDIRDCYEELDVHEVGHRKIKMFTTKVKFRPAMPSAIQDALQLWVDRHANKPLPKKQWKDPRKRGEIAVNWGYYDTHIGMYSWAKETGADWDVDIAVTRVLNSVDEMVERLKILPAIDVMYMPIGNDLGHFDGVRMTTSMGDHHLDVDTRFPRVFDAAVAAMAYQIERAAEVARILRLIWVPGNHDGSMSYGIFRALCMRYRNWPQIEIVENASERKYEYFHQCILGFDHGKLKPEAYQAIIMNECRGHLDNATYVEMNVGHTHEAKQQILKTSVPTNGVQVRTHPSLCPADKWHFGHGFLGAPQKSVEALYYGPHGRIGDMVVYANDDRKRNIDQFIQKQMGKDS